MPFPIPNLSLGFTGGTVRPENYGDVGGGLNTGGLTFGGKSGAGIDGKTLLYVGATVFVAIIILKKI